MRIITCVKAVPGSVSNVKVADSRDRFSYQSYGLAPNESDLYALEEAVALKDRVRGEVTVISMGPRSADDSLYGCLARRGDKAVRVEHEAIDPRTTARVLAEAIKRRPYDLILTGVESHDVMAAQVGVLLAMNLGLPFAYAVTSVDPLEGGTSIRITKEIGGGVSQVIDAVLPAVLCIQTGIRHLTYPPLASVLKAKRLSIEVVRVPDLGINLDAGNWGWHLLDAFPPQQSAYQAEIIGGSPAEAAKVVVSKVREVL